MNFLSFVLYEWYYYLVVKHKEKAKTNVTYNKFGEIFYLSLEIEKDQNNITRSGK